MKIDNKLMKIGTKSMIFMLVMTLSSCFNEDHDTTEEDVLPTALVTLKTNTDGHLILQLNDSVQLDPINLNQSPYGSKELRAFINYRNPTAKELQGVSSKDKAYVYVNWLDSIHTKNMESVPNGQDLSNYVQDPLEVVNDWSTVCEDGYLTIRFRTYFGSGKVHEIKLVNGPQPFDLYLCHNAKGDLKGQVGDGIIAFRLDQLPQTDQNNVTLTLHWQSFSGPKSTEFKYKIRK